MQRFDSLDAVAPPQPSVCTIGAFDGVHLGHQQLIRSMVQGARARQAQATVVTFFPHPRVVLGRAPDRYLTLPDEKAEQIAALGVDVLVVHPFTPQTVLISAEQFLDTLRSRFQLLGLWVGADFALGHQRKGDVGWLCEQGARLGFEVHVVPHLSMGNMRISSTRIRDALARGDIRDANLCLGRPFHIRGYYNGDQKVCADPRQWLPAPGTYAALVEGRTLEVSLSSDAPCTITLEHPLPGGARVITLTFV
ncbi:MAG: FAD synthetase family protein [Anaerolineae bacterium]|nr:FAD synthetase family protein [Thermoflexales bacterium]MDW8394755.1 FAD synthetase family protein [Anaerolineae bacterium]